MIEKKMFKKGNRKISKKVTIAATLPTTICKHNCKNCYAKVPERLFKTVRNFREFVYQETLKDTFVEKAIAEIKYHKNKVVRLHESGDFYSAEYIMKWYEIALALPNVQFYTYTKVESVYKDEIALLNCLDNFNVINSVVKYDNGKMRGFNYGNKEYCETLQKYYDYFICPCSNPLFVGCGDTCNVCTTMDKVCFVEHTGQNRSAFFRELGSESPHNKNKKSFFK